jgi:hypothetical protein
MLLYIIRRKNGRWRSKYDIKKRYYGHSYYDHANNGDRSGNRARYIDISGCHINTGNDPYVCSQDTYFTAVYNCFWTVDDKNGRQFFGKSYPVHPGPGTVSV